MRRRAFKAFTLAEILTSILIIGVVMGAVITLFYSVFESYQFHQDITAAKQNGQNALAAKLGAGGHAQLLDLFGE